MSESPIGDRQARGDGEVSEPQFIANCHRDQRRLMSLGKPGLAKNGFIGKVLTLNHCWQQIRDSCIKVNYKAGSMPNETQ
jgi:hypothetical protein